MAVNKDVYLRSMSPYAAKASKQLGVTKEFILAQWAHESGWGGSQLSSQGYNHAGLKKSSYSKTAAGTLLGHARYNSLNDFVSDYVRVMQLPYYKNVLAADTLEGEINAIGNSPYAEDPNYTSKMRSIAGGIAGKKLPDVVNDDGLSGSGVFTDTDLSSPKTIFSVGALGFVLLLWLFK